MCENSHKETVTIPDGWETRYDGTDIENGFCPDHAIIAEFAADQCPGCVGGWGDCPLFDAFAYSTSGNSGAKYGTKPLSSDDHQSLRDGFCPRRVNGTFEAISGSGVKEINISEQAKNGGEALSVAIQAYVEKYAPADAS